MGMGAMAMDGLSGARGGSNNELVAGIRTHKWTIGGKALIGRENKVRTSTVSMNFDGNSELAR